MKIGQKRSVPQETPARLAWLLLVLAALVGGVWLGQRGAADWLADETTAVFRSFTLSPQTDPLSVLAIDMAFADYTQLLDQRAQALREGVFIAGGAAFQPATLRIDGQTISARIRLREGPAVHLGDDDKWNYEVRTRGDAVLFDLKRFYLIDPADNNWLAEWAFQQNLARDGLLATDYQFVRLTFNGDDRGVYALQEGFGPALLARAGRPSGVIVEFVPDLLWRAAAQFSSLDAAVADPISNLTAADFHTFEIDAFGDATIDADPALAAQRERAIALLRDLQRGRRPASEIFDIDKMGRFLALVDLWGATDAVSLVNLRYAFNPDSERLEPIGFNGNPLVNNGRLPLAAAYDDPAIQAAYLRAAAEISQPSYLEEVRGDLDPDLRRWQRALRPVVEQPLPWAALQARQSQIRASIHPIQPVFATLGPPPTAVTPTLAIDVANVLNLPVVVVAIDVGGVMLDVDPAWIDGDGDDIVVAVHNGRPILHPNADAFRPVRFRIPLTALTAVNFDQEPPIHIAVRLLGLDDLIRVPVRPVLSGDQGRLSKGHDRPALRA